MRRSFLSLILITAIALSACQKTDILQSPAESFTKFTDDIFRKWVASDSLTLNYTLQEPSDYKVTQLPKGFLNSSSENIYNLKFWIDCNAGNEIMNKTFSARIGVQAI